MFATKVPEIRIGSLNDKEENPNGKFVLYWMVSARRTQYNFGLQHAIEIALEHNKPLVVFEALRLGYPWASPRFHQFVVEGMADNQKAFKGTPIEYYPYVEQKENDGKGLLERLAEHALAVVTDDTPFFFMPKMQKTFAGRIKAQCLAVDSNGIYPFRHATRAFTTAASFRRHLQKCLGDVIGQLADPNPLKKAAGLPKANIDGAILKKWPKATCTKECWEIAGASCFDKDVGFGGLHGGAIVADSLLKTFLKSTIHTYVDERNQPQKKCQSFLSPYLHFGHISSHQIFHELMTQEGWSPLDLAPEATGSRQGWWGASAAAEAFLDQFITWRELSYNGSFQIADYTKFDTLPGWAQKTLHDHAEDPREYIYTEEQFEYAQTHDALWNAAQNQLRREGSIHNYLRMLWGKKILEWTKHPTDALRVMIQLNNKYAYDGRNPNSYGGIMWTLGRYDRAWGPERPVFGKIRFMSSANTARKVKVKEYIKTYS